jgi:transposase
MGVPAARWSMSELAHYMVAVGLVVAVASSTIWRWLKVDCLKPWRYHFWQHCVAPNFLTRATAVVRLYEQADALLKTGVWVVCADEKTSIQAREGVDDMQPARPAQPVLVAARYTRRGALQLFAGLSVADGQVFGLCQERKRFVDFQTFITDSLIPQALERHVAEVALILDNGPTHAPKRLDAWLAQEAHARQWPFVVTVYWLPTYASWLDQVEIWFSILQRKLLTPNHFMSKTDLQQRILAFIAHYNKTAKAIAWSFTEQKLIQKFGTV